METWKKAFLTLLFCGFLFGQTREHQTGRQEATQNRFDELVHLIRTGNAYQRAEAIPVLASIDDPRVVPVLVDSLKHKSVQVRTYAAQQLARLADDRSAGALATALGDTVGNVRRYAAEGLAKIGDERHVPSLVKAVTDYLPDPETTDYESRYSMAALDAIGNISSKAPLLIVKLLDRISDEGILRDEDWWRLLANAANCLGGIGDIAAYRPLQKARVSLEQDYQDYNTWYAVRKALSAIGAEDMAFDRPASDILQSVRGGKITDQYRQQRWVKPLAELGPEAVADIEWALRFEDEHNGERKLVAIKALGEISGREAYAALNQYIEGVLERATTEPRLIQRQSYLLRMAMLALLEAEPQKQTVEQVLSKLTVLDDFQQEYLMSDVFGAEQGRIPEGIKVFLYSRILLSRQEQEPFGSYAPSAAAKFLGQIGGEEAGQTLGQTLLKSENARAREAAARALGTITGYDAVPTLIRASKLPSAPVGAIAQAMGTISDPRAIPALRDMAQRDKPNQQDRLWIAAALARFGQDYEENAKIIRDLLPSSISQTAWLNDSETIKALTEYPRRRTDYYGRQAIQTLEAIATPEALESLITITEEEATDPLRIQELSAATARLAGKLKHPTEQRWAEMATVTEAVREWFVITQRVQPSPQNRSSFQAVRKNPALARKIWIAEANRRLDIAAGTDAEEYMSNIPHEALIAVERIFAPELVPVLERIVKQSTDKVSFHGKYEMVDFYMIRSLTARILTEKTGKQYTFVDVDGRTHPGGWDPSQ